MKLLYTVTVVLQDKADSSYLEQVFLIEAESEEQAAIQVRKTINTQHFTFVLPDDVRPLLFGDTSDSLFCRHFEDIQAYEAVWQNE